MTGTEHTEAVDAVVDLDGVRLHTRRVGSDPPVVVLHGGPGADYAYLLPQYDRLAHGRALLFYDQRGGGRSPVARDVPVGWQEHVADLEALRKHWAIDRLTLLGYSRSEEHTSELQSQSNLVCRLLLEKKKQLRDSATTQPIPRSGAI